MTISTNQKPTIYRNLYENTGPEKYQVNMVHVWILAHKVILRFRLIH